MEILNLKSVCNIRDFGGAKTTDKKTIKSKRLIRSSALCNITPEEARTLLNEYNVKYIIDFRTESEIAQKPDLLDFFPNVNYKIFQPITKLTHTFSKDSESNKKIILDYFDKTVEQAKNEMKYFYSTLPLTDNGINAYKNFLKLVQNNKDGSIIWHCSFGKDRAGFAAVLVEYILGVSIENIYKDYLSTKKYIKPLCQKLCSDLHKRFGEIDDAPFMEFQTVHTEYLDSSLESINKKCGNMDNYLKNVMELSKNDINEIRENYLESI